MGDHDASEVALTVGSMMKVLSEERGGARVIKSHGDLSARLMHMATHPGNEYKQKVAIVYELYMTRRVLQGPVDLYVEALKSICAEGGQGGQQKNGNGQQGDDVQGGQDGQQEEDLGDVQGGQDGQQEEDLGDVQGGQDEQQEEDLGDVQGGQDGQQEEDLGDVQGWQDGQQEEDLGDVRGGQDGQQEEGGQDGQEEEDLGDVQGGQDGQQEEHIADVQGGQDEQHKKEDLGFPETWKSLSRNKAPLAQNTMPRASFDVENPCSIVQRFSPWTGEVWESDDLVTFSMTSAVLQRIPTRRRTSIKRNYNAGKMFVVLRNGQKAMAPSREIQRYVDNFTRARGSKIVLEKYMVYLKKAVIIKDKRTKEAVQKRRTPYGTGKYVKVGGKGMKGKHSGKRKHANVFDVTSDDDTELDFV